MEISQPLIAPPRSSGSVPENIQKTEVIITTNQWNFQKDGHTFSSTAPSDQHSDYQTGFQHFTVR